MALQRTDQFKMTARHSSREVCGWLLVAIIVLVAVPAYAGLRDIHINLLPRQPEIQEAYKAALKVEPMAEQWTAQWRYSVPKAKVAATLDTCLKELEAAEHEYPHNEELLLLTGTVASYAYNLDDKRAYDAATTSLKEARALDPNDPRPQWFLASMDCGTGPQTVQGMNSFLKLESQFSWKHFPADFWEDYMSCATLTNMPVHTLRAAARLRHLGSLSPTAKWYVEMAHTRIVKTSTTKTYAPRQVWRATETATGILYFSDACGFGFPGGDNLKWEIYGIKNGVCRVTANVGPFQGKAGTVVPEISVFALPPRPGETLSSFGDNFARGLGARPTAPVACPVSACLAFKSGRRTNMYPREGGGFEMLTVFESKQPQFPNLIFEKPHTPPAQKVGSKVEYFRPLPERERLAGTLYYLVLLDSAESVATPATNNYIQLLKSLKIDTAKMHPHL